MPQYLIVTYIPDNFDPSTVTEDDVRAIHAINQEMEDAGILKYVGGLSPATSARTLRSEPDGKVVVTDGPFTETKEHVGGFMIIEAANLEEALRWARRGTYKGGAVGEVREIVFYADPNEEGGETK